MFKIGESKTSPQENTLFKEKYHDIEKKFKELEDSKIELEYKLHSLCFSQKTLEDDDAKVKYYTGLPKFAILMALFNFLAPSVESGNRAALSLFQQFIVALMKLRLNVGDRDLAFRFGVNQSTISRYISKWMDAMYLRLKPLIKWPERDLLLKTMPMDFRKNFKDCVTIIDCFEVFMERPTNLKARAQTW